MGRAAVRERTLPRDDVPLFSADEDALEGFEGLAACDLHRGLVLEDGRLVGLLSVTDFARLLGEPRPRRPRRGARG